MKAGHALIFDYRTKHRGLGNQSSDERPLLYITCASGRASDARRRTHARRPAALTSRSSLHYRRYSKPFFSDVYNFDKKRYQNLPQVSAKMTREERAAKRVKR